MKLLKIISISLISLYSVISFYSSKDDDKIRILLIGDSTTIGGKGVFETTIEDIINKNTETPSVEVINSALGGETAHSVVESGRYDKDIKPLKGTADYIFVRYGINDSFKRKPIKENFPNDYKILINRLKEDFPNAKIILTTIIPFIKNEEETLIINNMIKDLAKEEKTAFFDVYPAYKKGLTTHGENSMNVRFVPLSNIPEAYKEVALPYSSYVQWKKTDMVRVLTNELDPIFNDVEGWYNDRHPNPMGYRLLALETANYILPELKKNLKGLPLSKDGSAKDMEIKEVVADKIYKIDVPKNLKVGEEIKVSVNYSATQKRDLRIFIQLNEAPWTTFFADNKKVNLGRGTVDFTIKVPKDIPTGNNYKIAINLLPEGKDWQDRLDDSIQNNVTVTE